jgi:hypothetical protein
LLARVVAVPRQAGEGIELQVQQSALFAKPLQRDALAIEFRRPSTTAVERV